MNKGRRSKKSKVKSKKGSGSIAAVSILTAALLLFPLAPEAFSRKSCGSASCPLNTFRSIHAGSLSIGWSYEYIMQDRIFVGSTLSFVGAIPEHHDEVETLNERNILTLQLGISDRASLEVLVPFVHREHSHIQHVDTTSSWESWNFSGLGDITLTAHYRVVDPVSQYAPAITLDAGLKTSSGASGLRNGDGEEGEVPIQPGTGSVDGLVGLHYEQNIAAVPMLSGTYATLPFTAGLTFQFPGSGTDGYRFGNSLLAHVGSAYQFLARATALLQVNGRLQGYADVGSTEEPRGNTGGTWIFLSPGLEFQFAEGFRGRTYVQFPVYQNVNGIQQTARYNLFFNLNYVFDLGEGEASMTNDK